MILETKIKVGIVHRATHIARRLLVHADDLSIGRHNRQIAKRYQNSSELLVAGLWNGHDAACCLYQGGKLIAHIELERYLRIKQPPGDSAYFLSEYILKPLGLTLSDVDLFATCFPRNRLDTYGGFFALPPDRTYFVGHHTAHAAHAFYSSNFDQANILSIDGGGYQTETSVVYSTFSFGDGVRLSEVVPGALNYINIGGVWSRCTRFIFGFQNSGPIGSQTGTVMAMAALGDPQRFVDRFYRALTKENLEASTRPPGQDWYRKGMFMPTDPKKDPEHPYWNDLVEVGRQSEQDRFDIAAGLQAATERVLIEYVSHLYDISPSGTGNFSFVGGVALNSVALGKIKSELGFVEHIYVPPVPADDGLCVGAVQYLMHAVLGLSRVKYDPFFLSYMGVDRPIDDVVDAVQGFSARLHRQEASLVDVARLIADDKIISIYQGRSESGYRALGNRSILANPTNPKMKELINEKVKHRFWFRPFAPTILEEEADNWFENSCTSPYMNIVLKVKEHLRSRVPAIIHFDGSARLQTLPRTANPWYYDLISEFYRLTGVPLVLNTSFNDREPIVETPEDAIHCFLKTDLDHLYFVELGWLLSKNDKHRGK